MPPEAVGTAPLSTPQTIAIPPGRGQQPEASHFFAHRPGAFDTGPAIEAHVMQLSLPIVEHAPALTARDLVGVWSLGQHPVRVMGNRFLAHAWLALYPGERAVLSLRYLQRSEPSRVQGTWYLDGPDLVVRLEGRPELRDRVTLTGEVASWAGKVMVRQNVRLRPRTGTHARMITADDSPTASGTLLVA